MTSHREPARPARVAGPAPARRAGPPAAAPGSRPSTGPGRPPAVLRAAADVVPQPAGPDSPSTWSRWPLRLRGPLDGAALAAGVDALIARHEILRTRYALGGPTPVQVDRPAAAAACRWST